MAALETHSMDNEGMKETAESVLRELPGVVGAFVQPDAFGGPREIHLLIKPGPQPREFAQHVRTVLESRLRIPIDKRIISIAQLADEDSADGAPAGMRADSAGQGRPDPGHGRLRLMGVESRVRGTRVTARVRMQHEGDEVAGEAREIDAKDGRARAAALAAVDAMNQICGDHARFGLDFASVVEAVGESFALVSVAVTSPHVGRRPISLSGGNQIADEDTETAAALAVLKATNRVFSFVMGQAEPRLRVRPRKL